MLVHIELDTALESDRRALYAMSAALTEPVGGSPIPKSALRPEPAPAKAAPAKAAPAKAAPAKAAPAKAAPAKAAPAKAEPAVDPAKPAVDPGPAVDLDTAVAVATDLVARGKTADVKLALAAAGAKRVSELKGTAIAKFLEALEDAS